MQVQAKTKFTGISAQKTRLVLDEMRGRQAEEALAILAFMPQGSAKVVAKTIKSALSNAVENLVSTRRRCMLPRSMPTMRRCASGGGLVRAAVSNPGSDAPRM